MLACGDGTQFLQQVIAIGNGPPRRRIDKGKGLDIVELQGLHAQDDRRQRRAQHFRIGKRRPCFEIVFGIQTNAYARPNAAAASGALIGRSLTDGLDTQLPDLDLKSAVEGKRLYVERSPGGRRSNKTK